MRKKNENERRFFSLFQLHHLLSIPLFISSPLFNFCYLVDRPNTYMTTEYYQIPSQQGLLPLNLGDSADPWLAAATNSLSLNDWSTTKTKQVTSPPSLFEPGDAEASVSWKHVIPLQYAKASGEVKAPVAPKQFNSFTSKIDAWSIVVDDTNAVKQPKNKQVKQHNNKQQQVKQVKQVKQQQQQQQQQPQPPTVEDKVIEEELTQQNISLLI